MHDIIIIGGGLAGLTSAILLRRQGLDVVLLEQKEYPLHRVCGEYVSNEVIPFLKENDLWPGSIQPAIIDSFQLSDMNGKELVMPLDLGGFGISRYALDAFFVKKAEEEGVLIHTNTRANDVQFNDSEFWVQTNTQEFRSTLVIGAFGKRSTLDKKLNRGFMKRRSPYLGVKYHLKNAPHDINTVALHNFEGGYCGVNAIEDGKFNLCYLSHRDNLKRFKDVASMEKSILFKNPYIRKIYEESEFLWDAPLVINEISFETKEPVIHHVLTCGDAAGMITPLCGNGMAMAIHSGKLVSDCILKYMPAGKFDRTALEREYRQVWNKHFDLRLSAGRQIQKLFGNTHISNLAVTIARHSSPIARYLMSKTHGIPFH
jgi:flavin-dependent dehydrogenase